MGEMLKGKINGIWLLLPRRAKKYKNQRINKNNNTSQKSVDKDYIYSSPTVPNDARIVRAQILVAELEAKLSL